MAFADDLQSFLETRLQAWIPSIDLSVGSPARVQVIDRVLDRFKQDPLSTDIPKFIIDRMIQEFPDLAADDGGMLEDMLVKPLQLLLEPFKREIELVKLNQSVRNAALMSEDEADAHAANWFEDRDAGDYSSGTVRLYFSQPTTSRVSVDKRLYTSGGLSFFPSQNYFITAQQMLFNRQGSLYYLDVVVRAESPGERYNVSRGEISAIDQVAGVVKVSNLTDLTSGRPRETNTEFMTRVDDSLTERSLVTKRGSVTRTEKLFEGVRAMQVVGAGEDGMNRDILTGTGEGFLHLAGAATAYGDWLWAYAISYKDDGPNNSILPQAGDTLRFHPAQLQNVDEESGSLTPNSVTTTYFEGLANTVYTIPANPNRRKFRIWRWNDDTGRILVNFKAVDPTEVVFDETVMWEAKQESNCYQGEIRVLTLDGSDTEFFFTEWEGENETSNDPLTMVTTNFAGLVGQVYVVPANPNRRKIRIYRWRRVSEFNTVGDLYIRFAAENPVINTTGGFDVRISADENPPDEWVEEVNTYQGEIRILIGPSDGDADLHVTEWNGSTAGPAERTTLVTAPATTVVVTAKILAVLSAANGKYLFLLDRSLYAPTVIETGAFALFKPGYITISGIPGGMALNATVPDNVVHLGGHTDVFVRPTDDVELQGTLSSVSDETPLAAVTDLGVTTANDNTVRSTLTDFVLAGVRIGDVLVIETGAGFAGTYTILEVTDAHNLRVDTIFEASTPAQSPLRARIVRNIRVDLIEPHIPKLPFTAGPVSDLQTTVGSDHFKFASINVQDFGAKIGDTINVLEGPDAGEFTILSFNSDDGAAIVDRVATATGAALNYQIYTRLAGISRPLVRLKSLEVLDSTGQGTGISIPYGDAVDVRPLGALEGAGRELITYGKQLVIFPDMPEWKSGGLAPDAVTLGSISQTTDARYTLGLEQADGVVRKVTHHVSNQVETTEINVPPFVWNGRRDKLLALVSHRDNDFSSAIAGMHSTSDIAKSKIGDSLTIYDGPNQGRYIITDLRLLDLWGKTDQGHRTVAVVQVDPPLKVDPLRTAINFINDVHNGPFWTAAQLFGFLQYAADWDNVSGFYSTFITQLRTALNEQGVTFASDAELRAFFDPLIKTSYSVGPSAKGDFRLYFQEPVSVELHFGNDPTTFDFAGQGETKKFRVDPSVAPAQIFPEAVEDTAPSTWNRNLGVKSTPDRNVFLTSGSSFVRRGVQVGDVLEYRPAILDLPARKSMSSSWLCATQTGSNIVQLLLPQSQAGLEAGYGGAENYTLLAGGQLLFIDSGPDIGAYTVVKVLEQDWAANPPKLKVQLDRPLSHTTENFPVLSGGAVPPPVCDFQGVLSAWLHTGDRTFPMASLTTKKVAFRYSTDGGSTWAPTVEYTFVGSGDYASAAAIAAELNLNGSFASAFHASADGNDLFISTNQKGPRLRIKAVAPSSDSAYTLLPFVAEAVSSGGAGAVAIPGSKRIYGNALADVEVDDWITIYAAKSDTLLAASSPDDAPYLGTFKVTVATDDAGFAPYVGSQYFAELDRGADFPEGDWVFVRYVRHGAPEDSPPDTSGGGRELSDQFARFRLYDAVSKKLEVTSFPWSADDNHPLLDTSETQLELESPGLIDTTGGQKNYSHMSPYRILRTDVIRVSSTAMSVNRDQAFYFIDVPVVGYGPGPEMNVSPSDGFVMSGNRRIDGYMLEVADENFAYSNKERVDIILPNSVLPVGSTADLENKFSLAGQNIQVIYNYAPLVDDIQSFFNSPQDRVTAANILVRHFLPAYIFLDAEYVGGSAEAAVAESIIDYLNNVDPNVAEIRTDLVQDRIKGKGASKVKLPLTLISLFHGIDRRIRGMRSETAIGLGTGTPYFKGTYLQAYFIAGQDTSRKQVRPTGEQIYLVRL